MPDSLLLIAEIGSVHDGSFGNAQKLIELATECGATAVKFQTHIAEAETLANAPSPRYFQTESRIEYFHRTSFSLEQWKQLKAKADDCNIFFLSSPFSLEAVDLLEEIEIEMYKIPSGEVTNIPMLEKIANLRKPVLLSSGMSNWDELDQAVQIFQEKCELTVMQCSSTYPCLPEQVGLNLLQEMQERYHCHIGFSDHTLGCAAPIAAVALGATVIEKHFTFSKRMYGSDALHSMEPNEFQNLANALQEVWQMKQAPVDKNQLTPYVEMKEIFQKSIVGVADLAKGTVIGIEQMAFKKPGTGIPAADYKKYLGCTLAHEWKKNTLLTKQHFSSE